MRQQQLKITSISVFFAVCTLNINKLTALFVCFFFPAEVAPGEWTDDTIKLCLYLYLALLPQNHKLFHE